MSELIAVAPNLNSDPPATRITGFVPDEIDKSCNGNVNLFARLVNVNNITVYSWCYNRSVPQNDLILKVCFATGKSYVDLLTGKDSPALSAGRRPDRQTVLIPGFRRHKNGEVGRALVAALTVDPPRSFREVSESLGYKSPDFLSARYPHLRRKIVERYRIYSRTIPPAVVTEPCDEAVESVLRQALNEPIPPSIQQIGKRLGYPNRYTAKRRIKKKFPDLHDAVAERRKIYLSNRRESIRQGLQRILLLEPPPTLDHAIEALGFKDSNYLRKYYPELCRSIVRRSRKYRTAQPDLINELRTVLRQDPPVSLRVAATRLGKNPSHLSNRFPNICNAISRRYRRYVRQRSRQRKKEGASKIRATALELHANGIYPSAKTIVRVLNGPQSLNTYEITEVLRKVRRKLKIHSP